jgi:hypothetical protein
MIGPNQTGPSPKGGGPFASLEILHGRTVCTEWWLLTAGCAFLYRRKRRGQPVEEVLLTLSEALHYFPESADAIRAAMEVS